MLSRSPVDRLLGVLYVAGYFPAIVVRDLVYRFRTDLPSPYMTKAWRCFAVFNGAWLALALLLSVVMVVRFLLWISA